MGMIDIWMSVVMNKIEDDEVVIRGRGTNERDDEENKEVRLKSAKSGSKLEFVFHQLRPKDEDVIRHAPPLSQIKKYLYGDRTIKALFELSWNNALVAQWLVSS